MKPLNQLINLDLIRSKKMKFLLLIFTITFNSIAYCQAGLRDYDYARNKFYNGDFVGALELIDRGIEKEKSTINLRALYMARANTKLKLKDYSGCIADYTKVVYYGGYVDDEILLNRAEAKNELKDYRGAIKDYDSYLRRNGFNIEIAARGPDITDSEKKRIKQKYTQVYFYRGNAKYNLEDLTGAKLDYETIITIDSDNANGYFKRGLVKIYLMQNKDDACLDFSKAGELGLKEAYDAINKLCK